MFCLHCKVDLSEGAKFCPECGHAAPIVHEVKEEIVTRSIMPEVMTLQQASKHFFGGSIWLLEVTRHGSCRRSTSNESWRWNFGSFKDATAICKNNGKAWCAQTKHGK